MVANERLAGLPMGYLDPRVEVKKEEVRLRELRNGWRRRREVQPKCDG